VECTSLLLYAPSLYACSLRSLPATRASELELNRSGRHGCTIRLLHGRCVMRLYDRARVDTSTKSGSSVRGRPLWGLRPLQGQCREWGSMWGRHSLHPWSCVVVLYIGCGPLRHLIRYCVYCSSHIGALICTVPYGDGKTRLIFFQCDGERWKP